MLAPLEDFTDSCFRTICYRHGADLTFTELTRFESLARNNKSTWNRIKLYDDTPTMIQLIGDKEQSLKKMLTKFSKENGFMGFNLNLGCPAPNFVERGLGCAMIKRIAKTKKLVKIIQDYGCHVNIKMRLGLNQYEKEKKVYLNLIENVPAQFFVVHARHGKQGYNEKADWNVFAGCVKTGKNIIANGDIKTKEDVEKLKAIGCKGVMIGRTAITNPFIFNEMKNLPPLNPTMIKKEYQKLILERNPSSKYPKNVFKHFNIINK